jgi:F0F1-type ATP synthase assembly protein I
MNETENNQNSNGPWWKPGVQILSEVSTWIVVPIVLALVFGKMLDAHYGTKPIIFLVFAGLGFLVTCLGIFRIMKNYTKKLKDKENK